MKKAMILSFVFLFSLLQSKAIFAAGSTGGKVGEKAGSTKPGVERAESKIKPVIDRITKKGIRSDRLSALDVALSNMKDNSLKPKIESALKNIDKGLQESPSKSDRENAERSIEFLRLVARLSFDGQTSELQATSVEGKTYEALKLIVQLMAQKSVTDSGFQQLAHVAITLPSVEANKDGASKTILKEIADKLSENADKILSQEVLKEARSNGTEKLVKNDDSLRKMLDAIIACLKSLSST